MADDATTIRLTHRGGYQFLADFEGAAVPDLVTDEPPPLGSGQGPSPTDLLLAGVANCLAASLLFALGKFKLPYLPSAVEATARVGRNDEGRLRVLAIEVDITLDRPAEGEAFLARALDQFEAFCTVSQSVGQGIPIQVEVFDAEGVKLH